MVGAVGGEQILNMGDGCQYVGLVLHEFGHAIGYFHEHNRPDRDDVVNIMWDNIQYGEDQVLTGCLKQVNFKSWSSNSRMRQNLRHHLAFNNLQEIIRSICLPPNNARNSFNSWDDLP